MQGLIFDFDGLIVDTELPAFQTWQEIYQAYGWASARLDDAAGYLPARLTAALVAGVRPGRAADIWRAVHSQAPGHPSPNAGVVAQSTSACTRSGCAAMSRSSSPPT